MCQNRTWIGTIPDQFWCKMACLQGIYAIWLVCPHSPCGPRVVDGPGSRQPGAPRSIAQQHAYHTQARYPHTNTIKSRQISRSRDRGWDLTTCHTCWHSFHSKGPYKSGLTLIVSCHVVSSLHRLLVRGATRIIIRGYTRDASFPKLDRSLWDVLRELHNIPKLISKIIDTWCQ